jgi:acyl-CoA thioesterase-2
MTFAVADLVALLDLETIEENIFGGLVVAQALVASARTVADRPPHSLHGYFMRPGDPSRPILYEVERLRDGQSFSTRRCVAIQHGRPIFTLAASFQAPEEGFEHQIAMPDVPAPDTLPTEAELMARFRDVMPPAVRTYFERERPIELRPVDLRRFGARPGDPPVAPVQHVWMRAASPLPDDPAVHRAVLAYLSDMTLLDAALVAHHRSVFDPALQVASLDHALWIHRPLRADQWLLYAQDSPWTAASRGMARGSIFTEAGELVASVAQEGLLRSR